MSDVQIFHAALQNAASNISSATVDALTITADLIGDDTGVENPASRPALRLELYRRVTALHDAAMNRAEVGSNLGASISTISSRYNDLDVELTGQEQ